MKCCLCDQEIAIQGTGWKEGHNADPLKQGRCCKVCNDTRVIPARLGMSSNPGSKALFLHAVFQPKKRTFKVKIDTMTMELATDQFLHMATYFAKVGASYNEWLKEGGKL